MADEDTPASIESADGTTDEEQINTTPFITAVVEHLSGAYDEQEHSLTSIDDWDPIKPGYYGVGEGSPDFLRSTGVTTHSDWCIETDGDSLTWKVDYGRNAINLMAEGETDDGARAGTTIEFDADGARDLARALLMAAEEHERRPVAAGRGEP